MLPAESKSLYLLLIKQALIRVDPLCCLGPPPLLQVFINIHLLLPCCTSGSVRDTQLSGKCYIGLLLGAASVGGLRL